MQKSSTHVQLYTKISELQNNNPTKQIIYPPDAVTTKEIVGFTTKEIVGFIWNDSNNYF